MTAADFGRQRTLENTSVDAAVEKITAALADEGFGVLTTIDVKTTLKKKIDVDFHDYRILGACNPKFAHQALQIDPSMGLMLPCNIVVQAQGDDTKVEFINAQAMFAMMDSPEMKPIADEVDAKLQRALAAL